MSLDIIHAVANALKNGFEGAYAHNWNEDDAEAGFWLNLADYHLIRDAIDGKTLWRPIWTAPKDGTHILVGTFPVQPGHITTATAHWFSGPEPGWALSVNYDGDHSSCGIEAPTHWHPLPLPPPLTSSGGACV